MKIAYANDTIMLKDVGDKYTMLKSLGMKRDKSTQTLKMTISLSFLNSLSKIIKLPEKIENERQKLILIEKAIDVERAKERSIPYIEPPVKIKPYQHQIKAYNMALIVFEVLEPQEVIKNE